MVVEVLGSRVLGPFYGVSLFVWTSLITVTLVALAGGYAAGGVFSDKRSSPDYLYGIIFAAGVLVLLIPVLKVPVLKFCLPLGLRAGSLASAFLLFGPALFLLGCVSPYLVRIAAREIANIGKTVGVLYAVSTVGSFIGTVLTGFVLISWFGINHIFTLVGLLLVALSTVYAVFIRRKWRALGMLLLVLPLAFLSSGGPVTRFMPNGTRVTRIHDQDSFYGNLKVVDYSLGVLHNRELLIDGMIQSGIDVTTGLSVYAYPYFMEFLPFSLNPRGKHCLVIGLGAGVVPLWYEQQGVRTDVVDIDPAVGGIARDYFGFRISGDVTFTDARYFLSRPGKAYDYIVLDVFNGDTTPGHLLSAEAMDLLSKRLAAGGILAINLAGSLVNESYMTASVAKTVGQAFSMVEIYPTFTPEADTGWGNLAVIAYNGPQKKPDFSLIASQEVHHMARNGVALMQRAPFRFPPDTPAVVLTDDYNPLDIYDLWLKEIVRKYILAYTDWDILI